MNTPTPIKRLLLLFSLCIQVSGLWGQSTFSFIENKGQWTYPALFEMPLPSGYLFLEQDRLTFNFYDDAFFKERYHHHQEHQEEKALPDKIDYHAYQVVFEGANPEAKISGEKTQPTYYNYFLGKDRSRWASEVRLFSQVTYEDIYQGIDLVIYTKGRSLKYDFIVHPGADPKLIRLRYDGPDQLFLKNGSLMIETSVNAVRENQPIAYQDIQYDQSIVPCFFHLQDNIVSFDLPESYDATNTLVIDPDLIFSTYSGSSADNFGHTATYDSKGSLYSGGTTSLELNGKYPVTTGAYQFDYAGGNLSSLVPDYDGFPCDITISKYSPDGSQLIYATYLGGVDNEYPHSLVVNQNDELIVLGTTASDDFPTTTTAYDTSHNGNSDIIISRLSVDGKQLLGSTYIGGMNNDGLGTSANLAYYYADDFRGDIIPNQNNEIYVASCTFSPDFPKTPQAFQQDRNGLQEGCVFKLSADLSTLEWSSFMGGTEDDAIYSIDIDPNDNLVVAGGTSSNDFFPASVTGGYLDTFQGGSADGFVAVIAENGQQILSGTYIGTLEYDQVYAAEIDIDSNIYIVGQSEGPMPVSPGLAAHPNSGQFLMQLNPTLDQQLLSTVFGSGDGQPDITINAFLVDECGKIYVSGWGGLTASNTFSATDSLPVTADAEQRTTDGSDFYLIVFSKNIGEVLYATFFGGSETADHVDGGTSRFDKKGVVYQSVCASCPSAPNQHFNDFPTTVGAFEADTNASPRCSNAAFKFDFRIREADFEFEIDTCTLEYSFTNKTRNADNFFWDFGDGNTSTDEAPKHTYENPGDYTVTMVANPNTVCADTAIKPLFFDEGLKNITIPNVFTPNDDGFNDDFRIKGISSKCDTIDIIIYNRWGQVMHKSDDINNYAWKGNNEQNSKDAPAGVYYYIVDIKAKNSIRLKQTGTITLIREIF